MTSTVAEIALMYVLPLGVTAVLVMQAAASELLYHRIVGGALSLGVIALDFLFLKGILFSHTTDGGLILSFINLAVLGILFAIRGKYTADFAINIMFSIVMGAGIVGIIFSSHPTLVVSSDYTPEEIAQINAKYQDYIKSFNNGGKKKTAATTASAVKTENTAVAKAGSSEASKQRLEKYIHETDKVIEKMNNIIASVDNFELLPQNISEEEREERSQQALAINNNATTLNRKTLGLFHPHESSEAHSELIFATESVRLAAYSLYTYCLQDNPDEQTKQYQQARSQIMQARKYIERFQNNIQNLNLNYQPQQEEN